MRRIPGPVIDIDQNRVSILTLLSPIAAPSSGVAFIAKPLP